MISHHPYIKASLVASILAIVVWMFIPKEYAATIKVSDEYKETDLAVGLNRISAKMREATGGANEGMNDIEVYCKAIKTKDFAIALAKTEIPQKHITYGQWVMQSRHFWQSKDTFEIVCEKIEYNINIKQQTLTVQFTDSDPIVASLMLNAAMERLQDIVTTSRQKMAAAILRDVDRQRMEAYQAYQNAQKKYALYEDSHNDANLQKEVIAKKVLQEELESSYKQYKNITEQYVRQKSLKQRTYCSFAIVKNIVVPQEDTSHLFVYIFVFVFFSIIGIKGAKLLKKQISKQSTIEYGGIFSPWSITMLVWGAYGVLYIIFHNRLYPLTSTFYISITLWVTILSISSFVTYNIIGRNGDCTFSSIDVNRKLFRILLFISIVLTPLLVYNIYRIVILFDVKDILFNIRQLSTYGYSFGILKYSKVISHALFLVAICSYPKINKYQLILSILLFAINSIAIMEKGGIFVIFLCSIYVLYENNKIKLRSIVILGLVLLGLFFMFNIFREGTDSVYSKNETFLDFIIMYIISPPVAYSYIVPDLSGQFGVNTFSAIYGILERLGNNVEVRDMIQEFILVPTPTNVYTVMQPFYLDFGESGVAFFALLYGIMMGLFYRKSKQGNALFRVIYTYCIFILVMQFFQDNFFLPISGNLQLFFIIYLLTFQKNRITVN